MSCCPKAKCLWLPRWLGAFLGLLAILFMVAMQLSFLGVQLLQGAVMMIVMPLAPLSLSWVVNHLYATPIGRVHVWAFQLFRRFFANGPHSSSIRVDFVTTQSSDYAKKRNWNELLERDAEESPRMVVHSVACLMDNYSYLLVDHTGEPPYSVAVIDPSDPHAVISALQDIARTQYGGRGLTDIQNTGTNEREWEDLDNTAAANAEVGENPVAAPMMGLSSPSRVGESDRGGKVRFADKRNNSSRAHDGYPFANPDSPNFDGFSDVLRLECVLATHRHWDHSYGNATLKRLVPSCTRVYGGRADAVPACTHPLDDGDLIRVGSNLIVRAIATPCHTRGSMCYHVRGFNGRRDALFTGDTLFCGGCGAPFEGDADDMSVCFQRIWLESAPDTQLFPGHEYSEALLPEYFKPQSVTMPLPHHPKDFEKLTDQFWRTHRNRRSQIPPLPTIPISLETEMCYNAYFGSLHNAVDALVVILRRQRMAFPDIAARRSSLRRANARRERIRLLTGESRNEKSNEESLEISRGNIFRAENGIMPCPPGLDPEVWSVMTPLMKQEVLQDLAQKVELMERRLNPNEPRQPSVSSLSSQFSHNQSLNLQRNRRLPSTVVDSSHEAIPDSSSSSQPSASQHLEVTFGGAPSTEEADEGPTGSEKSSESSTTIANKPPGVDKKLGNEYEGCDGSSIINIPPVPKPPSAESSPTTGAVEQKTISFGSTNKSAESSVTGGAAESAQALDSLVSIAGGAPSQHPGDDTKKRDTNQAWGLVAMQEEVRKSGSFRSSSQGHSSFSNVDYGVYAVEVTMEMLVKSLQTLSAGGDRIKVRDIYRALTTLGNYERTLGKAGENSIAHDGWRGVPDIEARELIDMLNLPENVLMTPYDQFDVSNETLVVEYVASRLSAVCDNPPPLPAGSCFLALCRTCKICPPTDHVEAQSNEEYNGSSIESRYLDATMNSRRNSTTSDKKISLGDLSSAIPQSSTTEDDGSTIVLRGDSPERPEVEMHTRK